MSRARLFDTIQDAGGSPIVGASVAVYEPNTTTPIAETLYADDIGGTTLSNPLATGADGSVLFYLDLPRRVDLYITSVGQTPRTVPDFGVEPDPAELGLRGQIVERQLDYTATADLFAAAISATTWTNLGPNHSFTVDNTNSLVEIAAGGVAMITTTSTFQVSSRLLIDGATVVKLGGAIALANAFANALSGGAPHKSTGLSAGSHTVQLQVYSNVAGTLLCRPSTQPELEHLRVQVTEFK